MQVVFKELVQIDEIGTFAIKLNKHKLNYIFVN